MSSLFGEIQPAVKEETKKVAVSTIIGVVLMWAAFAVLHAAMPGQIPLNYTVFLAGIGGGAIAVLNFFLMGLTVQKVALDTDDDTARLRMRSSYSRRMLLQMLWVAAAIVIPCFQFAAGIIPLFFPSIGIKITGILKK